MKEYFVYIMTIDTKSVLYVRVTNNLERRIQENKSKLGARFTRRYHVNKLLYYEVYGSIDDAIHREKQIKAGSRRKKILLIEKQNPDWKDLCDS